MKAAIVGTLVLLASLAATAAHAAEPAVPAPLPAIVPSPPAEPVFDWAGAYLGVQGGYNWNNAEVTAPAPPAPVSLDIDGGILGIYGGFNLQRNSFVFGLDGSVNYSFASESAGPAFPPGSEASVDWTTLLRGRAGFAFDQVLVYGTAGLAGANINATLGGGSDSVFAWGWTVGGGVEVGITDNLVGRIDYSFADYDFTLDGFAPDVSGNMQSHILMGGFAIKY